MALPRHPGPPRHLPRGPGRPIASSLAVVRPPRVFHLPRVRNPGARLPAPEVRRLWPRADPALLVQGAWFLPVMRSPARRMLDSQAHITDAILPDLPIRQFVFTFPFALRYRMAFDPALCADVRRVVMRALFGFYRDRATKKDNHLVPGPTGALVATQRFRDRVERQPSLSRPVFRRRVLRRGREHDRRDSVSSASPSKGELARLPRGVHRAGGAASRETRTARRRRPR